MRGKEIRVQTLDPEHPSFAPGTVYTIFGESVASGVSKALGDAPDIPGRVYARAWCCADHMLYHFVSGRVKPVAQRMLLRTG